MTQNKQFKLEARRYAEEHGLTYADARRRILEARDARQHTEPRERRPDVEYCLCNHQAAEHRNGTGLCRAQDDDDQHCGCRTFEHGPDTDAEED